MLNSADGFSRSFVQAWGRRDAAALAALCTEDAEMLTITGLWCEGRARIQEILQAELDGAFVRSRLVTGKGRLRPLGPGAAVLTQRFVLSSILDAEGRDVGRVGQCSVPSCWPAPKAGRRPCCISWPCRIDQPPSSARAA